mgnify:CR=1 FL=1
MTSLMDNIQGEDAEKMNDNSRKIAEALAK